MFSYVRIYIHTNICTKALKCNLEMGKIYRHITLLKVVTSGASLAAQWLRICLLMQGTRVRALVWEDPTCRRATRVVRHNH